MVLCVAGVMSHLVVNSRLTIPAAELQISFARSGGPGGQNVNKVATKVELRWNPAASAVLSDRDRAWLQERLGSRLTAAGELLITSSKTRDQAKNRDDARAKMAAIIRTALQRPKIRRQTRPSRGSVERRLQDKKQRSERKRSRRPPHEE